MGRERISRTRISRTRISRPPPNYISSHELFAPGQKTRIDRYDLSGTVTLFVPVSVHTLVLSCPRDTRLNGASVMSFGSKTRHSILCLSVSSKELQCSMWPVGALHPVHAQLERFEVGMGCAAREGGPKETHVISVGKASNTQVTVVLRPLALSRPVNRPVILVLSSQHPARWVIENEGLPHNINVLVQVSLNSTAESASMSIRVTQVSSLPQRPRVLLRWILQRHATISSLTHTVRANRVYLRLGEDPSMPNECRLQSLFLSQNYLASETQEQEVHGCMPSGERTNAEVHVIRLWSSGSGLCSSLQVEVSVSLLPPVVDSGYHMIVLVLSSAVSVNWALVAPEVRGHIRVYSANSVSLPYSRTPDLTMTSTIASELLSTPDLLEWADQNGFPQVTSYTESDLANRFVIQLKAGGTGECRRPQWSSQEDLTADRGREALTCRCDNGDLTVTMDIQMLQTLSSAVATVTLRDRGCQAEFNGSHFLLVFPVISCGTEGETDGVNRLVHYTNTVFLWRQKPSEDWNNNTDWDVMYDSPLSVHISCESFLPSPVRPVDTAPSSRPEESLWFAPAPPWVPRPHGAPILSMELFVTEAYEKRHVGPCVITAYDRVYTQVSVSGITGESVELHVCWVSPLSDPQTRSSWSIITDSCASDPSVLLTERETRSKITHSTEHDDSRQSDRQLLPRWRQTVYPIRGVKDTRPIAGTDRLDGTRQERETRDTEEESALTLRFSFILRPVFNNSIQFLHCTLRLCASGAQTDPGSSGATAQTVCPQGPRIPALTHVPASKQCEYRNLSRPVLVTSPVGVLAPPAGKLAQKPAEMSRQSPSPDGRADTGAVLVIVFVAFVMAVSLMGALWCIYTNTGRREMTQRDPGA
ncbi:transforming growth factor beta receptor type 3-like [Xyrauchen texanus]|uniref:transforming growth factor beta receptor type 3-like n=1 Tax=Xyrauchen texanus TaxID=154827 RepID=UPI002241A892|nr:transforming growth factor beta receptor type 3-like [Xyrauchen texanus]